MNTFEYASLSTLELITRVHKQSEQEALNFLLSNRKLIQHEGKWHLLSDFLWNLRQEWYRPYIIIPRDESGLEEKLDLIYDRTLQKFSILKPLTETVLIPGPYCNQQYKRIYDEFHGMIKPQPVFTEIERESQISRIYKKTVVNHLRYSWLEVCRLTNRFFSRYRWQVGKKCIELKKPIRIAGHSFRKWLEENIPDPDPDQRDEKERVQTIINAAFGFGSVSSMEIDEDSNWEVSTQEDPIKDQYDEYVSHNLYESVAREKALTLRKLRPAIRKLGQEKVKCLVLQILNMYLENIQSDEEIAREYGISKSTFSRFAGRNWKKGAAGSYQIPDLWRNMAGVILKNSIFSETALSLGIGDMLEEITQPAK